MANEKFSQWSTNNSPVPTDNLLSVQTPGSTPQDVQVPLSKLILASSNPVKFSYYAGTSTSLLTSTYVKLAFNTKEYDTGSNFDNVTNNRFTAPLAGFYQFSAALQSASGTTGEYYTIALYKNGSLFKSGDNELAQGTNLVNITVSPPLIQLAVNDYIEVWGFTNSTGTKTVQTGQTITYFGGYLQTVA